MKNTVPLAPQHPRLGPPNRSIDPFLSTNNVLIPRAWGWFYQESTREGLGLIAELEGANPRLSSRLLPTAKLKWLPKPWFGIL